MSIVSQIICPCNEIIMKSDNGTEKIRSKILLLKEGKAYAVCKSCNREVEVPLKRSNPVEIQGSPALILTR